MRTTIDLRDDQRARLLEIAARRGEKGFSGLVEKAVDLLLREEDRRDEKLEAALAALGTLSDDEAEGMLARTREIRESWR